MSMLTCAHAATLVTRLLHMIIRYYSSENRGDDTITYDGTKDEDCSTMNIGEITVGVPSMNARDLFERARTTGLPFYGVLEVEADRALKDLNVGKLGVA